MKVAVLYSGGKDSNFALYEALEKDLDVEFLLNIKSKAKDSYMFHTPCVDLTRLQAESIGIPLIQREVSGVKEREIKELEDVLKEFDIEGIVSGAIASNYQKSKLEDVANKLEIKSLSPLWGINPEKMLRDILSLGFKTMIVAVAAHGLDESWLGKVITKEVIDDLNSMNERYGIHISGEGGEFETLVVDGPIFNKKIVVKDYKKVWEVSSGYIVVKEAILTEKM